jgi:hypothetical protein
MRRKTRGEARFPRLEADETVFRKRDEPDVALPGTGGPGRLLRTRFEKSPPGELELTSFREGFAFQRPWQTAGPFEERGLPGSFRQERSQGPGVSQESIGEDQRLHLLHLIWEGR